MAALVAAIHDFRAAKEFVDARNKSAHDEGRELLVLEIRFARNRARMSCRKRIFAQA
jgi:hypothetical protein